MRLSNTLITCCNGIGFLVSMVVVSVDIEGVEDECCILTGGLFAVGAGAPDLNIGDAAT